MVTRGFSTSLYSKFTIMMYIDDVKSFMLLSKSAQNPSVLMLGLLLNGVHVLANSTALLT